MPSFWSLVKNSLKGLKDLTTIGSANAIVALISGIFWFFMASLLGTEAFGKVNYFISIANIVSIAAFLGAGNTILVYTAKENKIQSTIYLASLITSVVAAIAIFFVFFNLGVSLFIIGFVIFSLATNELLAKKLYKDFSKYMITQRILLVGLATGLYFLLGPNGIILGFALSYFPYFFRVYRGLRESKIDLPNLKSRSGFIMNSYALDLSGVLSTSADKLIIFPLFGFALLGNYSLGVQFLLILSLVPLTVFQYILPSYAQGSQNTKIKKGTILVSVVIAVAGIVIAPIGLPIFFPKFNSVSIIQIMSLGIIPISINYIYNAKFLAMGKNKNVIIGSGTYLAVQFLGIVVLGRILGIDGAAIALVLGASSQTIYLVLAGKLMNLKNPL